MPAPAQLIDAACHGEEGAIVKLLDTCQPDLHRFARRTCSSAEDAEDAVQLALWLIYRKIGALRSVAAFATWIFRIVERECYRLFASRGTISREDLRIESVEAEAEHVPINLRIDLSRAISRLPPSYRAVLIMRDVDELSAPEVSRQLAISIAAVKSRLHRARAILRDQLVQSGYRDLVDNSTA